MEGQRTISSPEEELAYLRAQVAQKERELSRHNEIRPQAEIIHERIIEHRTTPAEQLLTPSYTVPEGEVAVLAQSLRPRIPADALAELNTFAEQKGIKNAFALLEKMDNPHLADDFHRLLVSQVASGVPVQSLGEKDPARQALNMVLYEITLPEPKEGDSGTRPLKELISAMEQFYSGMLSVESGVSGEPTYYSLELAIPADRPELTFYAAIPRSKADLFEKQLLAIFPDAYIAPQPNDYNIFTEGSVAVGSQAELATYGALPLKDYSEYDYDPLNAILNAFAKLRQAGEGAALQLIVQPKGEHYVKYYRKILSELRKGEKRSRAFTVPDGLLGELGRGFGDTLFSSKKPDAVQGLEKNRTDIEQVEKKIASSITATNIRLVVSAATKERGESILSELEAAFNQFTNTQGNSLRFVRTAGARAKRFFHEFSFRLANEGDHVLLPLSLKELTTVFHFPPNGISSTPHLRQSRFTQAPAPMQLPEAGALLGHNRYRGAETPIYLSSEDRLRHLYVIGQTGTGKTTIMKNLVVDDIRAGNGVCFIDPHGNDILDILANIPPSRFKDVIYFDPANLDRPFGLNLLEYDPLHPEQKTFIVNEMLAIFRRLYGDVPESMGPAFEQYFRNATLLVMEDPASGSTMMDIGRVLSNKEFRDMKLSKSMNPIVNQFWNEIATKAGGEASLENIVPYITNKFDDFTANDFMRPIIGQQESSFNFRQIMDEKKILLVNLSKGRLGERNANLLGLIMVGKLFMAALSRADNPRGDFPPFYLYIDEFQNITTDSIPGILSEARKYRLSLTIAHQFLGQIDEKIRDAVFGNVGSMAVFRVGQEDAEFFEKQFTPTFSALDFTNIENFNCYLKMLSHGVPQKPFNIRTKKPEIGNPQQVDDLRELSFLTYGRERATVEALIRERYLS